MTKELWEIHRQMNRIINNNKLNWSEKYDLVFSKQISSRVFELIPLDYYDPDCGYDDDVLAFAGAFNKFMAKWEDDDDE